MTGNECPNLMGRIYVSAIEGILGKNGLNAALRLAGLDRLIDNPPADNLAREFDLANLAALDRALDDIVGPRGGRAVSLRAGEAVFSRGLQGFASSSGMASPAFRLLPPSTKLKIGLHVMAQAFGKFAGQETRVIEQNDDFQFAIEQCPVCRGRHSDKPLCHVVTGLIQEAVKWVGDGEAHRVKETACIARGDDNCTFTISKQPNGQAPCQ